MKPSIWDSWDNARQEKLGHLEMPWQMAEILDGECEGKWLVFRDLANDESILYEHRYLACLVAHVANRENATAAGVDEFFDIGGQRLGDKQGPIVPATIRPNMADAASADLSISPNRREPVHRHRYTDTHDRCVADGCTGSGPQGLRRDPAIDMDISDVTGMRYGGFDE